LQELTRVVAGHAIYPDGTMLDKRKAFAEHVARFIAMLSSRFAWITKELY